MEDRDRDEMSGDTSSSIGKDKDENWNEQPGSSRDSSEYQSERGRSGVSSDVESDSDLGSDRGLGESGNINRGLENEH